MIKRYVNIDGETHTISEWARLWGISRQAVWDRVQRKNLDRSIRTSKFRRQYGKTLQELADDCNITVDKMREVLKKTNGMQNEKNAPAVL